MQLFFFALLLALGSTSGATLPSFTAKVPPFTHLSVSSDMSCENYLAGAKLAMVVKVDNKKQQVDIPPQLEQVIGSLCPRFLSSRQAERMDVKVEVTVIDQKSQKPVMRIEAEIRNG